MKETDEIDVIKAEAEKLEQKMNKLVDGKIDPLLKQLQEFGEISPKQEQLLKNYGEKFEALQKQLNELDVKLQKQNVPDKNAPLGVLISDMVAKQNVVANWKSSKMANLDLKGLDLMTKDAGTVTRATDTIPMQWTPLQYVPGRRIHVRDLLPIGTTSSPTIWMPYESAITNGIARAAEGAKKGQSDMTFAPVKWPVEKIATFIKFSEEILDDMPQFTSYITTRWIELLKQVEDTKLLYGTGSSDIKGLTVSAAAYVDVLANSAIDRYMVLDAATTQVKTANFTPNFIILHPVDAMKLRQERATTKEFITGPNGLPSIGGASIIEHAAMAQGDFLVGDFSMGAQLWDRVSANIRFYDQDGDNAQYNLITAVIEERLALVTYQSTAFVFGDFASALAKGSA